MPKSFHQIKTQLILAGKVIRLVFEASPTWAVFYFGTTVVNGITPTLTFYIGKVLVDAVVLAIKNPSQQNLVMIFYIAGLGFGVTIINSLFYGLSQYGWDVMKDLLIKHAVNKVLAKSAELDLSYFESPKFHDQLEKVQREIYSRPWQVMDLVVSGFASIVSLVSLSFLLFSLAFWAPFLLIVLALPRLLYRLKFSYWTYSIADDRTTQSRKVNQLTWIMTQKDYATEVKTLNLKGYFLEIYNRLNNEFIGENRKLSQKQNAYGFLLDMLGNLSFYLLYIFSAFQAVYSRITIGDLTMFAATINQFQSVLQGTIGYIARFYECNLFLQHYFAFVELKPRITSIDNPKRIDRSGPLKIEFKNVSFGYTPEKLILKKVNLTISDAKNLALVGENGAGKTTLIKLLLRLYEVSSGQILINGVDVRDIELENLRQNVGVIFQDFQKYEMTVKENIGFGDINRLNDSKGIKDAARLSGASEFIEGFEDKYNTMLGKFFEKGEELSGGQWQKIALARAFFKEAPVLILDEPTSALDPKSEYEVFRNLIAHTKNKSLILISHRFSTVRIANEIVVLHKGEIVEKGSHEELMKQNVRYAKLYNMQAKWYK